MRHAPLLLGGLVVLSTSVTALVVAGVLRGAHGRALAELEARPAQAGAAIAAALGAEFEALLAAQVERPVTDFARYALGPLTDNRALNWVDSPLLADVGTDGISAFFAEELVVYRPLRQTPTFFVARDEPALDPGRRSAAEAAARLVTEEWAAAGERDRLMAAGLERVESIGLAEMVAYRAEIRSQGTDEVVDDLESVRRDEGADYLREHTTELRRGTVRTELREGVDGRPQLVASWSVQIDGPPAGDALAARLRSVRQRGGDAELLLLLGVVFDLDWWRGTAASRAAEAAGVSPLPEAATVEPGRMLPFEVDLRAALAGPGGAPPPVSSTTARFGVDRDPLRHRIRRDWIAYGLGLALVFGALGTVGVGAMRRLQRDLRQADRTGEFVAAVTHELRTPISTIKLHNEMLLDGWIQDAEQREEYYRRIDVETSRLARMVERILEQSRLTRGRAEAPADKPEPTDLSEAIRGLQPNLEAAASSPAPDLRFELADGLPEVLMTDEAIESVVTNLVENARKYAPADPARGPDGQILVMTSQRSGTVLLEVCDRGPGIPAGEQRRVFEAFYRVGSEATRTTTGTGLGLHLVQLQVAALGGRVEAVDRDGGGTTLRVAFPPV